MKRHRWQERYFNPFQRDYEIRCLDCGVKTKRSQMKRGGLGVCRPPLLVFFEKAERFVRKHGYGWEVDLCDKRPPFEDVDEQRFLQEYAWVVLNTGMSNRIINAKWEDLRKAFHYFIPHSIVGDLKATRTRALGIFGNQRKIDAIINMVTTIVAVGFETTIRPSIEKDPLTYLASLFFIGEITKYHLARNLGFEYIKPDRHLKRLASNFKMTPLELCTRIQGFAHRRLGTIDVILWRFCEQGGHLCQCTCGCHNIVDDRMQPCCESCNDGYCE